jgi:hypothetical protein
MKNTFAVVALLVGASSVVAIAATEWKDGRSSEGFPQRTASMTFDECQLTKARAITSLNIPPRKIIEIVNTSLVTVTRLCLDDGGSMLVTCSRPDRKIIITTSPHGGRKVGCPG